MRMLKAIGVLASWWAILCAIPAGMLYPFVLWASKHTDLSVYCLAQSYIYAVGLLSLPTGFLLAFIYRRFLQDRGEEPT